MSTVCQTILVYSGSSSINLSDMEDHGKTSLDKNTVKTVYKNLGFCCSGCHWFLFNDLNSNIVLLGS